MQWMAGAFSIQRLMILAIVGYGKTGKDTAADFLRKHTTLPYVGSTSWVALPLVADHLGMCQQIAWDTRSEHRTAWYKHCAYLKRDNPLFLVNLCIKKGGKIVTGLRELREVEACRDAGHHIMWVDSSGRGITSDPSLTEFDQSIAHDVVDNNGTIPAFHNRLKTWAKKNGVWIADHEQR